MKYEVKFKDEQLVLTTSSSYIELVCNAGGQLFADQGVRATCELINTSADGHLS